MRIVTAALALALVSSSALAEGVYTDGAGYAYAPFINSPPSPFGSISASFENFGGGPNGAVLFWNYSNYAPENYGNYPSVLFQVLPVPGDPGYVRPYLSLSDGWVSFATGGPKIWDGGQIGVQHTAAVAYGMATYGNSTSSFMHWFVDGRFVYFGSNELDYVAEPPYAFAPPHNNGNGWFAAWPADGGGSLGGVNFHPGDFQAFGRNFEPQGAPVWLRGSVWDNQFGTDIPWYSQGLVVIEDMVTWP